MRCHFGVCLITMSSHLQPQSSYQSPDQVNLLLYNSLGPIVRVRVHKLSATKLSGFAIVVKVSLLLLLTNKRHIIIWPLPFIFDHLLHFKAAKIGIGLCLGHKTRLLTDKMYRRPGE